jgi:hypothetical protein
MPRPQQQVLTPSQARRLDRAAQAIEEAEQRWAELVREFGISASARHLGITPQAMSARLRVIERDK